MIVIFETSENLSHRSVENMTKLVLVLQNKSYSECILCDKFVFHEECFYLQTTKHLIFCAMTIQTTFLVQML